MKATKIAVVPRPTKKTVPAFENAGEEKVRAIAAWIAKEAPELAELSEADLEAVARAVVARRLTDDLGRRAELAKIDYAEERATFLAHASRTGSNHTARAYTSALLLLDAWAKRQGLEVLEMTPRNADDFAYALATEGRAPASIRRDIAAASSFFTFLERRHDFIRNPFRGTKARPTKKTTKDTAIPSPDEIVTILAALAEPYRAAAVVMASRGLRVGALPCLEIRAGRFHSVSKGKEIAGEMPEVAIKAISAAGLDHRTPFAGLSSSSIAVGFRYYVEKLYATDKIRACYSVHDLRHAFAVTEYSKDRDIYRLSKLLGHASIQVTEVYLRGLGEVG
jgi:site-specific recombinase XerD